LSHCFWKTTIMAKKKPATPDLTEQSVALAEFAAKALIAAEQLGVKKKIVDGFSLDDSERAVAAELPALSATLKNKLAKENATFTVTDTASILIAVAESLLDGEPLKRLKLLYMTKKLADCLQTSVVPTLPAKSKTKKSKPTNYIYQFKITLVGSKPPIWRRIQVADCTLDKLHEHIQTAMGWTNSHLHQFEIKGERYGDPELLDDGFEDFECVDSTKTLLSAILPAKGKKFRFKYEYDFGDGWEHEVLFECCPEPEKGKKYPLCLDGERACPPEDCGGIWGYYDMLAALADPKHEQYDDFMEWIGPIDPENFDAAAATKEMKKGLPKWRE
jgi:hypothetical protein